MFSRDSQILELGLERFLADGSWSEHDHHLTSKQKREKLILTEALAENTHIFALSHEPKNTLQIVRILCRLAELQTEDSPKYYDLQNKFLFYAEEAMTLPLSNSNAIVLESFDSLEDLKNGRSNIQVVYPNGHTTNEMPTLSEEDNLHLFSKRTRLGLEILKLIDPYPQLQEQIANLNLAVNCLIDNEVLKLLKNGGELTEETVESFIDKTERLVQESQRKELELRFHSYQSVSEDTSSTIVDVSISRQIKEVKIEEYSYQLYRGHELSSNKNLPELVKELCDFYAGIKDRTTPEGMNTSGGMIMPLTESVMTQWVTHPTASLICVRENNINSNSPIIGYQLLFNPDNNIKACQGMKQTYNGADTQRYIHQTIVDPKHRRQGITEQLHLIADLRNNFTELENFRTSFANAPVQNFANKHSKWIPTLNILDFNKGELTQGHNFYLQYLRNRMAIKTNREETMPFDEYEIKHFYNRLSTRITSTIFDEAQKLISIHNAHKDYTNLSLQTKPFYEQLETEIRNLRTAFANKSEIRHPDIINQTTQSESLINELVESIRELNDSNITHQDRIDLLTRVSHKSAQLTLRFLRHAKSEDLLSTQPSDFETMYSNLGASFNELDRCLSLSKKENKKDARVEEYRDKYFKGVYVLVVAASSDIVSSNLIEALMPSLNSYIFEQKKVIGPLDVKIRDESAYIGPYPVMFGDRPKDEIALMLRYPKGRVVVVSSDTPELDKAIEQGQRYLNKRAIAGSITPWVLQYLREVRLFA